MKKNITIIIQGPLCEDGLRPIKHYQSFGDVIVSCWNTDQPHLTTKIPKEARLAINKYKQNIGYNFQNIKYQIQTTLAGLDLCKTEYVIKVRSDEYFTDIFKIVESIKENSDKLIVSNFFFRKDVLFHPSDHIIGGKTENIRQMFENALEFIKDFEANQIVTIEEIGLDRAYTFSVLTAEIVFCLSHLKSKGIDVISDVKGMKPEEVYIYHREIIKENYSLVRASDLGHFLMRFKSNPNPYGPTAFTNEDDFLGYEIRSIKSLEEL